MVKLGHIMILIERNTLGLTDVVGLCRSFKDPDVKEFKDFWIFLIRFP